jgi:hypothetical protein
MKDTKRAREEYKRYIDLGGRDKATAQQGLDEIGQETAATDEASTTTASGDGTTTDTAATTATAVANTTTATTSN